MENVRFQALLRIRTHLGTLSPQLRPRIAQYSITELKPLLVFLRSYRGKGKGIGLYMYSLVLAAAAIHTTLLASHYLPVRELH